MGVPGFFAWLLRKYRKTQILLLPKEVLLNTHIDILYIDANCLFHPQCFKVISDNTNETDIEILEKKMFVEINKYILYLESIILPREYVYICVDGVAPLAKIRQQRNRRYKTVHDTKIYDEMKQKYNKETKNIWSNIVISPGTNFMEKLHQSILNNKKFKNKTKYIYSSYHSAGEGEHKILQHIKKLGSNKNIVVYGLDADLIFLTMTIKNHNMFLLREHEIFKHFDNTNNNKTDMICVSIEKLKFAYNNEIKQLFRNNSFNNIDFIDDFIFLCFLLGNDFLPHFPSIDIMKEGLEYILEAYVKIYKQIRQPIINKQTNELNVVFIILLFEELGSKEEKYFRYVEPQYKKQNNNKICYKQDKYEIELWELENMKGNNMKLGLGQGTEKEWKNVYYKHYFNIDINNIKEIDNICAAYLKSIVWVYHYYFNNCSDWQFQYIFSHAPFISDIAKYITTNKININEYKFDIKPPVSIMAQLISIIPPAHVHLIPENYINLVINPASKIHHLFPSIIKIDTLNKDIYWKCEAIIPYLDINKILEEIKDIKLSKFEFKKNRVEDPYLLWMPKQFYKIYNKHLLL